MSLGFLITVIVKAALVAFILLTALAYLQWLERKVLAHIQLRIGPRRVGPHGLLQPLADVVKLITKEDMIPSHVNKVFYMLAPFIAVMFALIPIAVIPFGGDLNIPAITIGGVTIGPIHSTMELTDLNIGVLFILGISGLGVYGVALAGWASNNKYSLLGGLRSSAQMISYELPMALAIATPLLALNSLSFRTIVNAQSGYIAGVIPRWTIFQGPFPFMFIAFILFIIAAFAETNRVPFDLPEAENELVAGFHTEYGSMKFAAFFMAEYCNMVTVSCVATLLFLGGWHPLFPTAYGSNFIPPLIFMGAGLISFAHAGSPARPFDRFTLPVVGVGIVSRMRRHSVSRRRCSMAAISPRAALCCSWSAAAAGMMMPIVWFCAKVLAILFVYIWVRGTLPRFRYDQLMNFAWTFLFPVAVVNLFVVAFWVALT